MDSDGTYVSIPADGRIDLYYTGTDRTVRTLGHDNGLMDMSRRERMILQAVLKAALYEVEETL